MPRTRDPAPRYRPAGFRGPPRHLSVLGTVLCLSGSACGLWEGHHLPLNGQCCF